MSVVDKGLRLLQLDYLPYYLNPSHMFDAQGLRADEHFTGMYLDQPKQAIYLDQPKQAHKPMNTSRVNGIDRGRGRV